MPSRLVVGVALVLATLLGFGASAAVAAGSAPLGSVPTRDLGDGAWSWFEGPRAIVTRDGCEVLASSVGGTAAKANVKVASWQLGSQVRTATTLDSSLFHDDHNSAGLVQLANGELLAAWSGHAQDDRVRIAVRGTNGRWNRLAGFTTYGPTTYNNVYQLSDGSILDFVRHADATSPAWNPDVYRSVDNGRTWTTLGQLLHFDGPSDVDHRPYVRYAQRGDRISFITTQGHPRELADDGVDAAIFAGYLEGTTIYRTDGTAVGSVGGGVDVESLSPVSVPAADHAEWSAGVTFDAYGQPVAVFSIRDRGVAWSSPAAIRYAQARYGPGGWTVHDLGPGGRAIYAAEDDYSGNLASDPADPDHVVVASTVDPAHGTDLGQYDLFDGRSADAGATWTWTRLTATAASEYRPYLTDPADGAQALLWFAGRYDTYAKYTTSVQFRLLDARTPADRAARCGTPRDLTARRLAGDFDGDGATDVLSYRAGPADDRVNWGAAQPDALLAGNGLTVNGSYEPAVGDFNGDGRDDVLWNAAGPGADSIWWGGPNRSFTSTTVTVNGTYRPVPGDFNGDGRADVLWYAPGPGADSIWWGNANRTFASTTATVNGSYEPVVGDFNGNGRTDILWYAPGAAADSIWWGNANRRFSSTASLVNGAYRPVSGDFNGNGRTDILWYAPGAAADSIWWGNANRRFAVMGASMGGGAPPTAGDFNGDGTADLFWTAPGSAPGWIGWATRTRTFVNAPSPWAVATP